MFPFCMLGFRRVAEARAASAVPPRMEFASPAAKHQEAFPNQDRESTDEQQVCPAADGRDGRDDHRWGTVDQRLCAFARSRDRSERGAYFCALRYNSRIMPTQAGILG